MNVKIDKYFWITKDEYNFFLNYRNEDDGKMYTSREKERKKGVSSDVWYYPTLELALKSYINKSLIKVGKSESIDELLEELRQIETTIKNVTK